MMVYAERYTLRFWLQSLQDILFCFYYQQVLRDLNWPKISKRYQTYQLGFQIYYIFMI